MTEEELLRRADQARQITENEMYREAWSSLEKRLMDEWAATKPTDTETREAIWHAMKAHKAHKARLEAILATGRDTARRIDQRRKASAGAGITRQR